MKTKVNGIALPPCVLVSPGAERSEAERSEAERSAVPGETKTLPDPEVLAKAKRRQFTADYKRRILAEADSTKESGAIGALLRREGVSTLPTSPTGASNATGAWRLASAAPNPSAIRCSRKCAS